ncbi:MAG: bifunctional diaminohydroxyphosphoribosylaminopyrimidine deaminase/5-amino-6-(5-phosphoribosylamino)uracil reductase RibD [Pseudomonadota bacterium]
MADTFSPQDHALMAAALRLASANVFLTMPNPSVGCVIVKDGQIVGQGATQPAGQDHAEVVALKAAGQNAKGATVYVTLEPCCTHGRTGPCTEALIAAEVAEVVVAMADPNPSVDGHGVARLAEAGITVRRGLMAAAAQRVVEGFHSRMTRGRPFVTLKTAASIDGATAMRSGESQWITSAAARRDVQRLRSEHAAIMTGIGTVLADDPSMTVRDGRFSRREAQPWRVVVDSQFRTPSHAKIIGDDDRCLVFGLEASTVPASLSDAGAHCLTVASRGDVVDLNEVMTQLAAYEVNSVLLECGPMLSGAMLNAGLVDRMVHYVAPILLGSETLRLIDTKAWSRLADGMPLEIEDLRRVGDDMRLTLIPTRR